MIAPVYPTSGPGVLFVHWLGDAATTNHHEFESDARALAKRGATCVLVDAMWSTVTTNGKDWFDKVRSTDTDYENSIAQVIDLRRALDLLTAQSSVDPKRIAYVAHDFGAMYGAVLSGVDPRPRYFVLMAGTTSFADWYLLGNKPADIPAYRAQMEPLDPLGYLARGTAKGYLFQFAAHDEYVTAAHATQFFDAAPLPRAMYVYDAHHDLHVPQALADRLAWLEARLF
jgi:dienelactone hydrolase